MQQVLSRLEKTLPFLSTLEMSPQLPPFLVTVSQVLIFALFICRAEKAWSEKASRRTRRCQSLAVPARLQWRFKTRNWESSLFSARSVPPFLSPDVYGSLSEGINVCTQGDEWLNLDLGGTEWDDRQSLQKALWWNRDNLQASSSLVPVSNCVTRVEWVTDGRKKSSGI